MHALIVISRVLRFRNFDTTVFDFNVALKDRVDNGWVYLTLFFEDAFRQRICGVHRFHWYCFLCNNGAVIILVIDIVNTATAELASIVDHCLMNLLSIKPLATEGWD